MAVKFENQNSQMPNLNIEKKIKNIDVKILKNVPGQKTLGLKRHPGILE